MLISRVTTLGFSSPTVVFLGRTHFSFSSQIRSISSVFTIGPLIHPPNSKMPTILLDNKPNRTLWMNHFNTFSNKGSITSKTDLSRPLFLLSKSGISTYTGIVASSTSTQDSQVNTTSTTVPQKFDISQLPEDAREMFAFPWKSPEIQRIVFDQLGTFNKIPALRSKLGSTIKEVEKLIGIKWDSFSILKTDEDIVAAFGSKCGIDAEVNKTFFFNIATDILQTTSATVPQKLDISELPVAAQEIFREKWASSELQEIVHLKISNMPRLNSQPDQFWNALEKLSYAEIQLFNDLKTDEDVVAAFGSKCDIDVTVNKPFFTNIATGILQIANPPGPFPSHFPLSIRRLLSRSWKSPELREHVGKEYKFEKDLSDDRANNLCSELEKLVNVDLSLFSHCRTSRISSASSLPSTSANSNGDNNNNCNIPKNDVFTVFKEKCGIDTSVHDKFFFHLALRILLLQSKFDGLREIGKLVGEEKSLESNWRVTCFPTIRSQDVLDRPKATQEILIALQTMFRPLLSGTDADRPYFRTLLATVASGTGKSTYFANCLPKVIEMAEKTNDFIQEGSSTNPFNDNNNNDFNNSNNNSSHTSVNNRSFPKFLACLRRARTLYIEFNGRGDAIGHPTYGVDPIIDEPAALVTRFLARGIMDLPLMFAREDENRLIKIPLSEIVGETSMKEMLANYFAHVRETENLKDDDPVILILQIDEYQMYLERGFLESFKIFTRELFEFSRQYRKPNVRVKDLILPIITGTTIKTELKTDDLSSYQVVRSQFTNWTLLQSFEFLESLKSASGNQRFDHSWRVDLRYQRIVGDAGGVAFVLGLIYKWCSKFAVPYEQAKTGKYFWETVHSDLLRVSRDLEGKYLRITEVSRLTVLLEALKLALVCKPVPLNTALKGDYTMTLDKLTRTTGIVVRQTSVENEVPYGVLYFSPAIFSAMVGAGTYSPLYDKVYQFPYSNFDGKMLEALTLATLHSRVNLWTDNHYGLKKDTFSLVDFLGWDSLDSRNVFRTQISSNNNDASNSHSSVSTAPNYTFPTRKMEAFSGDIDFEDKKSNFSSIDLLSIEVPPAKPEHEHEHEHDKQKYEDVKTINLLDHSNHLIINSADSWNFMDILVILRNEPNSKSLVLAIQLKNPANRSGKSTFDIHKRAARTLPLLEAKFPVEKFNHLVLVISTVYAAESLKFIRSIQNGGETNTVYEPKSISNQIIAIGPAENGIAFSALLPTYFSRYLPPSEPINNLETTTTRTRTTTGAATSKTKTKKATKNKNN